MPIDQRQPNRAALRRAVDSIIQSLADGHVTISTAGVLLDYAGCPFAVACRVCLPYRTLQP